MNTKIWQTETRAITPKMKSAAPVEVGALEFACRANNRHLGIAADIQMNDSPFRAQGDDGIARWKYGQVESDRFIQPQIADRDEARLPPLGGLHAIVRTRPVWEP